jgi:hypothetical protein
MPNTPMLSFLFIFTTLFTVVAGWWVVRSTPLEASPKYARLLVAVWVAWLIVQAVLALNGVYTQTHLMPPRIVLFGVFPPILSIIYLFVSRKGQYWLSRLPLKQLTYLHTVRIPVELVLWGLYLNQAVPQLMTFEGRNFDILAGLTAPVVAYIAFTQKWRSRDLLLIWNSVSLGLLFNIVIHAFLSAPSPLQQLAFDQPNIAILYFPYCWLPTFVVPMVLLSHLVAIKQLLSQS